MKAKRKEKRKWEYDMCWWFEVGEREVAVCTGYEYYRYKPPTTEEPQLRVQNTLSTYANCDQVCIETKPI